MVEKDYKLYGTKILNLKTQEIGLLICLWENKFADETVDCLGFLPRSQSFAFCTFVHSAQSARYPDSLCSVRTQIRSPSQGARENVLTNLLTSLLKNS